MTDANEKNIKDILGTDTASQEVAEKAVAEAKKDLDEKMRLRKIKLIKIGSVLTFVAIAMVIITLGWFSMNKETNATSGGVRIATSQFELKTAGYYGYYDDYLPSDVTKVATDRNAAQQPPSGTTSTLTTANGSNIQWLIAADYNANNYITSATKDEDKGIRPGSSGEMKFWVVSKGARTINITFKIEIVPYRTNYVIGNDGNYVFSPGSDTPDESTPISIATDNDYADVRNYLYSHLLFFKKRTTVTPQSGSAYYTYSDLIPLGSDFELVYDSVNKRYTSTLTFTLDGETLQDEPLSIYWVWPETLAEAVLPEAKQNAGSHAVCTGDEVLDRLKANPNYYLKGYNAATDTEGTVDANLTKDIIAQYYSRLSVEYNNADQEIGDNVGYILLTLSAE